MFNVFRMNPSYPDRALQARMSCKGSLKKSLSVLAGCVCLSLLVLSTTAKSARAEIITGLTTTNQLLTFDSATPGTIQNTVAISGLQAGETLFGIDYRPATGALYSVGSNVGGFNRIYTINTTTGLAQFISNLSITANGTAFGIDFNPTVDRLRFVSDNDQNLRINVDTGVATNDTALAFAAGDANAAANPNIVGSAYTNNFAGATSTTLYGIDSNLDSLVTQAPPNNGTLNTIGSLGFNTTNQFGFDISGASGIAYASLTGIGAPNSQLFTINLTNGSATSLGNIGGGMIISGLAVAPVPEPGTYAMMGIGLLTLFIVNSRKLRKESSSLVASSSAV